MTSACGTRPSNVKDSNEVAPTPADAATMSAHTNTRTRNMDVRLFGAAGAGLELSHMRVPHQHEDAPGVRRADYSVLRGEFPDVTGDRCAGRVKARLISVQMSSARRLPSLPSWKFLPLRGSRNRGF